MLLSTLQDIIDHGARDAPVNVRTQRTVAELGHEEKRLGGVTHRDLENDRNNLRSKLAECQALATKKPEDYQQEVILLEREPKPSKARIHQLNRDCKNMEAQTHHSFWELEQIRAQLAMEDIKANEAIAMAEANAEMAYAAARAAEEAASAAQACLERTKEEREKLHANFKFVIEEAEKVAVEAETRMHMVFDERDVKVAEMEEHQHSSDRLQDASEAALLKNLHIQVRSRKRAMSLRSDLMSVIHQTALSACSDCLNLFLSGSNCKRHRLWSTWWTWNCQLK